MKALIWIGGMLVFLIVKVFFLWNIKFSPIGEALYWAVYFFGAPILCKKWDKHRAEKKATEQPRDETSGD